MHKLIICIVSLLILEVDHNKEGNHENKLGLVKVYLQFNTYNLNLQQCGLTAMQDEPVS